MVSSTDEDKKKKKKKTEGSGDGSSSSLGSDTPTSGDGASSGSTPMLDAMMRDLSGSGTTPASTTPKTPKTPTPRTPSVGGGANRGELGAQTAKPTQGRRAPHNSYVPEYGPIDLNPPPSEPNEPEDTRSFREKAEDYGSELYNKYVGKEAQDVISGLRKMNTANPQDFLSRLIINSGTDFDGALGRTIDEVKFSEGWDQVKEGFAPLGAALINDAARWYGIDRDEIKEWAKETTKGDSPEGEGEKKTPDGALITEVTEGDKIKQDIADGAKLNEESQAIKLSEDLLAMHSKGVSKEDAFAELEKNKQFLSPQAYADLHKGMTTLYAADSSKTGPVTSKEVEDAKKRAKNIAEGKGDGTGHVTPEVTTPDTTKAMLSAADEAGKRAALAYNTAPVWYESDAFSGGLITFGMNLLSGKSYAESFEAASKGFDEKFAKEKRQGYARALYNDGYSMSTIEEWIETGKANLLKKQETFSTGTDDYGYFQKNNLTGKKAYFETKLDRQLAEAKIAEARAKAAKGGGGDKFAANPQVVIGRETMPGFAANWEAAWLPDIENYPMMETAGKFSEVFGRESTFGKAMHSFLLERQQKARRSEDLFMQSYGRPLSGGAITQTEWETWAGYLFPRPEDKGDGDALLRKQLTRDIVVRTISSLGLNRIEDPKEREQALVSVINQARTVAANLDGYNYTTGYYQLKDGSLYNPYEEAEKLRKSMTQGG